MTLPSSITGNDIANAPQGQALPLVLQELRLISRLLYMLQRGQTAKETLEFMRSEEALEETVKYTWS